MMRIGADIPGCITDLGSGDVWSGPRLAQEVARRSAFLEGICRGNRSVIIAHGGTPSFFADLFAVWSVGACALCVDPGLTDEELINIIDFTGPAVVLVDDQSSQDGRVLTVPVVSAGKEKAPVKVAPRTAARPSLDDPALVLFTSGTTGTPKGVVHSFRSLIARLALNEAFIGRPALARSLCVLPTHFGHGLIGNCLTPLLAGGDLLLSPGMDVRAAASLGGVLVDHGITFMSSVPAFWKVALKVAKAPAASTLQHVGIGSAPLESGLWRRVMAWSGTDTVVNMYGITEAANWVAGASARAIVPEDGMVGAMWGGLAAVIDGDGKLRQEGEGEIAILTPALMTGYLKRDDLTGEVMRDGWFLTGDLGRIGADRLIHLTGRRKSEINRAGIKVHPEEIDVLLERHPDVAEACTFGVPDEISGEIVGAAVVLTRGSQASKETLRRWCVERTRRENAPEIWFILSDIPKTSRGKIDRRQVIETCLGKRETT